MKKATSIALAIMTLCAGAQADELLVGVQIPLTGPLARVGMGTQEGIRVAAEVFNKTNGKHTIKLVTVDDESAPAKAVAAVEKLASEGVVAITGGYGSNNISPASDAANKLGLAYMTSGGVDDGLVEAGRKNFFRINNTAGYQKALVGLISDLGVKSVSIIYSTKDATEGLATDVQKTLAAKGIKVAMHAFDPAITDFKPIINKVKLQDRSEFIAMVGYENDYVGILRAARVLKPQAKAIAGVWSLATPKMAADFPDLMPNVYGTAVLPFPVNFTTPEGKTFGETYKKLHNKEPDYLGQFGYVQSMLLFDAIARAADKGTLK
jgi:branched-chain amino acid transport system substrate-binding protein